MGRIAERIADFCVRKGIIAKEQRNVCRYGYEVLISTLCNTLLLLLISIALHRAAEFLVFMIVFVLTRTYCGGYHADTSLRCSLTLLLVYGVYLLVTDGMLQLDVSVIIGIYLLYVLLVYWYAPIEHGNKKLSDRQKKRYRQISLGLCAIWGLLSGILYLAAVDYMCMVIASLLMVALLMVVQIRRMRDDELDNGLDCTCRNQNG